MKTEIAQESFKAAPPVAVTAVTYVGGMTLNDMVLIATLVYLGMQMGHLVWKWWKEWRAGRNK